MRPVEDVVPISQLLSELVRFMESFSIDPNLFRNRRRRREANEFLNLRGGKKLFLQFDFEFGPRVFEEEKAPSLFFRLDVVFTTLSIDRFVESCRSKTLLQLFFDHFPAAEILVDGVDSGLEGGFRPR